SIKLPNRSTPLASSDPRKYNGVHRKTAISKSNNADAKTAVTTPAAPTASGPASEWADITSTTADNHRPSATTATASDAPFQAALEGASARAAFERKFRNRSRSRRFRGGASPPSVSKSDWISRDMMP